MVPPSGCRSCWPPVTIDHRCEPRSPLEFSMSLRPDLGPKPLLGYTANHLARVAERRGDADFLAAREADPRAAAVAIGGELIVLKRSANGFDALFSPREVRALAPAAGSVF